MYSSGHQSGLVNLPNMMTILLTMMLLNAGRCREFNNQHSKTLKSLKMIKIHDTIPPKYRGVHKRLKNEKKKRKSYVM